MAMQQQASPVEFPVLTGGWCNWHDGPSDTALVIQWGESNSGPPKPLYACAPCREQRGLAVEAPVPCKGAPLRPVSHLSAEQLQGRACVVCGAPLSADRVYRGAVLVQQDGYGLDFDVWCCPPAMPYALTPEGTS
ncbi:hypothetical protein OHS33_20725 [Streptomyces sp. NBC_00536]|uniref:hypothetical protein n=1 Tax=Streptomyces sp. NBC_00536 TaxID=2975769 RepID=UPI002E802A55|nr:hypothetical protein [Streptomyces sp. NBC_00536]WUC80530.1 hypothetical protein OHS33_20725 [Streptomyces sp. NBC_00536]